MDLKEYEKNIEGLSEEEKRLRDKEYIRALAAGEIQGPPTSKASIDKPGLKHYDKEDFDYEIPDCSIYDFLERSVKKFGNKEAILFGEPGEMIKVSYSKLLKQIEKVAKSLQKMGVKKGDIVSVCLPNTPEVVSVFYAINKVGAIANMLDPRTNESTLRDSINESKSKILLSLDRFCNTFNNIVDETSLECVVGISPVATLPPLVREIVFRKKPELKCDLPKNKKFVSWDDFLRKGMFSFLKKVQVDVNDDAVIAYTGGTTGLPKGVRAANKNLNTMVVENRYMRFNITPDDTCLNIAPPWTYYGLSNCINAFLHLGVKTVMVPEFGPNDLGKLIATYKPNHIISVPSTLIAVMKEPALQTMDLSFIKTIIVGAEKMEVPFENEFNDWLAKHNCKAKVTKGYGMTEVTAAAAYTRDDINTPGNVGIPFIQENIAVFEYDEKNNKSTSKELSIGETGEIAFKGPKNMQGYYGNASKANGDVLIKHDDGSVWVHSGDLGHIDKDGIIYVDGRIKRMFTTYGFKVFAGAIESHIYEHPAVLQCAIIPVPDENVGSLIKAFVVLKDEYKGKEEEVEKEILKLLESNVYSYEIPSFFEFRDSLPLTGMNKVDFKALEAEEKEKNKGKSR